MVGGWVAILLPAACSAGRRRAFLGVTLLSSSADADLFLQATPSAKVQCWLAGGDAACLEEWRRLPSCHSCLPAEDAGTFAPTPHRLCSAKEGLPACSTLA